MRTELYRLMYERGDDFWLNIGIRRIVAALLDVYLPRKSNNKILDLGCGPGAMFSTFAAYGRVYGVDQSPEAVSYARRRNIADEVIMVSAHALPFADHTFDIVACFDVLYHQWVRDEAVVLKEIHRVLAPGGTFIIKEASYDWLRSRHDQLNLTRHRFNKQELVRKMEHAGFMVQKASYIVCFLFPLALVKRFLEKIFPEPEDGFFRNFCKTNIFLNTTFKFILFAEARLITALDFPFGLSVICIAYKRN